MALWLQNHRVTRFLNEDRQIVSELHQLITDVPPHMLRYHFNRYGHFFLACTEERGSIGFVKLQEQQPGCYEIIFVIGDESLWGNGYGYQLVRLAESQAFLKWRAKELTAKIYHGNGRSVRVVCNCGFREVRRLEHLSCYSITSEEYLELLTQKSSVLKRYC